MSEPTIDGEGKEELWADQWRPEASSRLFKLKKIDPSKKPIVKLAALLLLSKRWTQNGRL